MHRFKVSLLAAAGVLVLAFVLNVVGPKRVMAALGYTPVRDITNPALQPVQFFLSERFPYSVPMGKRLVIEHASADIFEPTGSFMSSLAINTNLAGQAGLHFLPKTFMASYATGEEWAVAQPLRLYADPGTQVRAALIGTNVNQISVFLEISGYLVDIP